ncbi:hypothetical protein [Candidatus Chloroploca asiatica]|uniref:Uncharacterized protein n=1 Tax=Candidatus Chloroploca asiatica TaxID=1506545 RepID=A0A2H3KLQ6_9CHLR|nr:hypothetical protein [Candidatus Chloroploca asiatica]PDV99017.1 hypothetical protein A9Q02_13730 [Candidatus Chloroploca asiatica]
MIRSVAPADLWSLRRKPRHQVLLFTEHLLAQSHRPAWFALRCMLQGNGRDMSTVTYQERGGNAVLQASGRRGRPEQDIVYLATNGPRMARLPSDYELWYRLLERICVHAGYHQIQRLYAAPPAHFGELREIFRQIGFQAYAHATILQLSGPDWNQGTSLAPMRVQSRRDHWAIHKLYGATTPPAVQQAEVRNARNWALAQRWSSVRVRAWVLGPDDDLAAYLRMVSGPAAHVFSLLIRPDARNLAVDVLRFGLAQLIDNRPVYLLLREYQGELLVPVEGLGFEVFDEQTLLVKHTVIPVRRPLLVPSLEPGLEAQMPVPRIAAPRED